MHGCGHPAGYSYRFVCLECKCVCSEYLCVKILQKRDVHVTLHVQYSGTSIHSKQSCSVLTLDLPRQPSHFFAATSL